VKLSDDEIEGGFYSIRDSVSSFISRPRQSSVAFCRVESQSQVPQSPQLFIRTHHEALSVAAMCVSEQEWDEKQWSCRLKLN
jgi:hypothetical protein